jgi:mono/diheme cytochrome c family protein
MRRLSLFALGSLSLAPLLACSPDGKTSGPTEPAAPNLDAPSVYGSAPARGTSPGVSSVLPPVVPVMPVEPVRTPPLGTSTLPGAPDVAALPPIKRTPMLARPISGGTLRILNDGKTAIAADSDRDLVYVVDLGAGKLLNTIALQPGDEPGRVVEDADGRVHVALRGGGAVATIDPVRATMIGRRALCAAPRGLAFDKKSGNLHVACAGGELLSIAATPTTTVPTRSLTLGRDLRDVIVKGDKVVVSSFRSASVYVVAADGAVETTLNTPENGSNMKGSVAWKMIDGPQDQAIMLHERGQENPVSTRPGGYGFGNVCEGSIVDSAISIIDVSPTDSSSSITSAPTLQGTLVGADVALSPDGRQIAVASISGGDSGTTVQFFDLNQGSSGSFDVKGDFGFECDQPSSTPRAPALDAEGTGELVGALPTPGAYLPPSGELVAVAYDKRGNVVVQTREPATLQILTQRMDRITLSSESRFDAGHQVFHTATKNRIACVSCHPEGGEDGRVWTFQSLGQRRTQSLRGGIMNTAPFHWNGDQNNFGSLMSDVFQQRMGGDPATMTRVGALSSWLNQIPTIPTSTWSDSATVARGHAIFTSAGCAACHMGGDFTNNQTVDVGTGGEFQVPQLHGLAFRAPFMHTGCAGTLRDRFNINSGCGGDKRHGNTENLTDAQLGDLIAYLDTL